MSKYKVGQTLQVMVEDIDENGKAKFKVISGKADLDPETSMSSEGYDKATKCFLNNMHNLDPFISKNLRNILKGCLNTAEFMKIDETTQKELRSNISQVMSYCNKSFIDKDDINVKPYNLALRIAADILDCLDCALVVANPDDPDNMD